MYFTLLSEMDLQRSGSGAPNNSPIICVLVKGHGQHILLQVVLSIHLRPEH